jgi:predicted nucleic acid-binding protein
LYLIDTNVLSELRKGGKANSAVLVFFRSLDPLDIYLPVQTIGELRGGIERLRHRGDVPQAQQLAQWLDLILTEYADRILGFDTDCTQVWGKLMAGSGQNPIDQQIAAIALIHGLTVVTRNTRDFARSGVALIDPFV